MTWVNFAELAQLGSAGVVGLVIATRRVGRSFHHGLRTLSVNSRGVVAVEAAFIVPAFLVLALGMLDVGMWSVQQNGIQIGIMSAERFISTQDDVVNCEGVVRRSSPLLTNATISCVKNGNNVLLNVSVQFIGAQMFGFGSTVVGSATIPLHSSTAGNGNGNQS